MAKRDIQHCGCGKRAQLWREDGTPLCLDCAAKIVASLLGQGKRVTIAARNEPGLIMAPMAPYEAGPVCKN